MELGYFSKGLNKSELSTQSSIVRPDGPEFNSHVREGVEKNERLHIF